VNVGVALALEQRLPEDVVAGVVPTHVELGIKDERVHEAEGDHKKYRKFKSLHGAKIAIVAEGPTARRTMCPTNSH
jgi:hypothetical protein